MKYKFKILSVIILLTSSMIISSCNENEKDDNLSEAIPINIYEGCCDTAPLIETLDTGRIYIPNVFTPNNDGVNDALFIYPSDGIEMINSYTVRNQENSIVFSNENITLSNIDFQDFWNGTDMDGNKLYGLYNLEVVVTTELGTTSTFDLNICSHQCDGVETINNTSDCAFGTQHNGLGEFDGNLPNLEASCF